MTYFISFRSDPRAGTVVTPSFLLAGEPTGALGGGRPLPELADLAAGRDVLLATHGFNVNQEEGVRALSRLEARMQPASGELFLGVLWPGDWWIPAINYPTEADDAVACGRRLASICNEELTSARSLSFLSHSLGGRLILEAVRHLDRKAKTVCVTAGAVDWDCLHGQYAEAVRNAESVSTLSSCRDMVLRLAYPVGDFASDVFWGDDDSPFSPALGYKGPRRPAPTGVLPSQIDKKFDHGHGNYLPPSDPATPSSGLPWEKAADFMIRAFRHQPQTWPDPIAKPPCG